MLTITTTITVIILLLLIGIQLLDKTTIIIRLLLLLLTITLKVNRIFSLLYTPTLNYCWNGKTYCNYNKCLCRLTSFHSQTIFIERAELFPFTCRHSHFDFIKYVFCFSNNNSNNTTISFQTTDRALQISFLHS